MNEKNENMRLSENRYKSNKKYNDKTYDRMGFAVRKEERLDELITLGANKRNKTKSAYMKDAILSQLSRDGISIDMLPAEGTYTPPVEPTQSKKYQIYLVTEWSLDESSTYQDYIDNPRWFFEEYISTFSTIKAATDYVRRKFRYKAHPEQWGYTIYGRDIEADTKRDAFDIHREMVKDAIAEAEDMLVSADDGDEIKQFTQILREKQKPDLVKPITYYDVKGDE